MRLSSARFGKWSYYDEGELAFEQIKTAWLAATVLRTVLSEVPKSDRERFIGLLRVDGSPPSSEAVQGLRELPRRRSSPVE